MTSINEKIRSAAENYAQGQANLKSEKVKSGSRKASVPTTLGEMDDYEFVVDTEVSTSTLKSGWSYGVPSGRVETGFVNNDPDLSFHHSKGMALDESGDIALQLARENGHSEVAN